MSWQRVVSPSSIGAAASVALALSFGPAAFAQSDAPPAPAPVAPADSLAAPPVTAKRAPVTPEMRAARIRFRTSCAPDAQKHCSGTEKGKGGLQRCLQAHVKELSPDCSAARLELRNLRLKKG